MIGERKLRVVHVGKFYPPHMGGIETHLQALCDELKSSVDVEVLVSSDGRHSSEESVRGIKVTRVGKVFELTTVPICPGMARKLRHTNADVVHLHLPNPMAIMAYLASGHPGRLVVTYHSDIIKQRILGGLFQPIARRALDRAAAIIATSAKYAETSHVLSQYRERCRVIPHGIPIEQFEHYDPAAVARIRAQYGPRLVLSVGRLIYYKGFEYLIAAMTRTRGRLVIIGDGPLKARLQAIANTYRVNERVVLVGGVEDVVPYYHAADVFVLPSVARSEAFGLVQLEAMACGKPVVNTRLASGVPFVSVDGETGLTVPPAQPEALASAINLLMEDPSRRAKYGEAGRNRVRNEFTARTMAQRVLELYGHVTASGR